MPYVRRVHSKPKGDRGRFANVKMVFRGDGVECAGKCKVKTVQCDYHGLISWTWIDYGDLNYTFLEYPRFEVSGFFRKARFAFKAF